MTQNIFGIDAKLVLKFAGTVTYVCGALVSGFSKLTLHVTACNNIHSVPLLQSSYCGFSVKMFGLSISPFYYIGVGNR
jgi:hypothetical protein